MSNSSSGLKALIFLAGIVLSTSSVFSQTIPESSVPAKARTSFHSNKSVSTPQWTLGIKNQYEAHFSKSGKNQVYVYAGNGLLMEKKFVSQVAMLPYSVSTTLAADFPNSNVSRVYRVLTRSKRKYYEVQVKEGDAEKRVQFDLGGAQIAVIEMSNGSPATVIASKSHPVTTTASGGMRGEAFSDDLIDDDIADLFEDDPLYNEDADYDLELDEDMELDDSSWDQILMEDDEEDIDLDSWDSISDENY